MKLGKLPGQVDLRPRIGGGQEGIQRADATSAAFDPLCRFAVHVAKGQRKGRAGAEEACVQYLPTIQINFNVPVH